MKLSGGSGNNVGTLMAHATSGTLTVDQLSGNPIIEIPHIHAKVSVPENSFLTDVNPDGVAGTLQARESQPVQLDHTKQTGSPRLEILANAKIHDARDATGNRYFNGVHGEGQLTLAGAGANTLYLTPFIGYDDADGNIYKGDLQANITAVVLDAARDPGSPANPLAGIPNPQNLFQAFAGYSYAAARYDIKRGIMKFYYPHSIRDGNNAVKINVGTTGSGADSTVVFASGPTWDLRAANTANNPTVTAKFEDDATIKIPATAANFGTTSSDFPVGSPNETPAALRLETFDKANADDLNIEVDAPSSVFYSTTAGRGYLKLVSIENVTANSVFLNSGAGTGPYVPGVDGITNIVVSFKGGNVPTSDIEVFVENDIIYIGYPLKAPGSGGPGGTDPGKKDVELDMTDLLDTDVAGGTVTVLKSGDQNPTKYNLSQYNVTIVVDPDDVADIAQTNDNVKVTFKYPTIHEGATVNVIFEDEDGNTRSYRTKATIVDGVSVLDFQSFGLPTGTYKILVESPKGANPFYTGEITLSYDYVAPSGPILYMFPSSDGNGTGIKVYARLTSNDVPVANRDITFTLEVEDGVVVKGQVKRTNSEGYTDTVTYSNLGNATYYIIAKVDGIAYSFASPFVVSVTNNPNPDPDPTNPTDPGNEGNEGGDDGSWSSGGGGGCDAGFGALLALAGCAFLRRKRG